MKKNNELGKYTVAMPQKHPLKHEKMHAYPAFSKLKNYSIRDIQNTYKHAAVHSEGYIGSGEILLKASHFFLDFLAELKLISVAGLCLDPARGGADCHPIDCY